MKVKVLYIGGSGRTGSTFLSLLLSQNNDSFNVGQIRDLPSALRRDVRCSCKKTVTQCEFWSKAAASFGDAERFKALKQGFGAFRKQARKNQQWNDARFRKKIARDHETYLLDLSDLYQAASKAAGGRALVDSSKSAELAFALSLTGEVSLFTLNLVRDPRAVTCSWAKRFTDQDRLRRQAREWRVRQKLFALLAAQNPMQSRLLRYEDLTQNPKETIASVLAWAEMDPDTSNFTGENRAAISWDDQHLFPPANEGVLEARASEITIRVADSWKSDKNAELHQLAERITFPAAEQFGYRLL